MRSPRLVRVSLVLLTGSALSIGLVATAAPRSFYDDFPFVAHWVELLPPYNEHLVTDVGGLYLGFAVIFAFAAATLERTLVRAAACAWLLVAAIHLGFHAGHLDGFSTADAIAELSSLAFLAVLPALALWGINRR
jgi:tRNA U34 5-methylaminomethyl-2-thiouridine-forming methyltransferase MnmC